ncbi:MAG TPA: retropepsin-like aspartic protease [Flavitalea sp.]|nr:retropepsin-like aspartic protease [Flavitalea sp.]
MKLLLIFKMRNVNKNATIALIIALLFSQIIFGQGKVGRTATKKQVSIPFRLTADNNLSVRAVLNKIDTVELMFHTAASSVTLTEEATKKAHSLKFGRTDSVKSWGGGGNSSRFSESNSLQIGDLQWENMPIWENKNSGPKTDGKFGTDLFKDKVIEVDFDKGMITLHSKLPNKIKRYEKLNLSFSDDMMFLEAGCEIGKEIYKNKFLIHSGYSGAVLLDDKFIAENKIEQKLKVIDEKELKDSFGNIIKTKKTILPAFVIGNHKLVEVPAGFFSGAIGRQKMSIIGGDILKRFNIIIDAQRQFIYLKSNKLDQANYTNT